MKGFVLIGLIVIFTKLSFVHADSEQLKHLAGKMIYRDVPAQNETQFSKEYTEECYELFSYNENIMELKNSNKKSIILERSLWDDGNWKEWAGRKQDKGMSRFLKLTQSDKNINHSCAYIYNQRYNLKRGDHVIWDKKCGHILIFDTGVSSEVEIATVAYCGGKSSPHYCRATDEVEYIGANNLTKSGKCFKYP